MIRHADYPFISGRIKKVRDSIEGEAEIKRNGTVYLPEPASCVGNDAAHSKRLYDAYKSRAEYKNTPKTTLARMVGQMVNGDFVFEIPEAISYLIQDSDGDGLPLESAIESAYSNVAAVKYHFLVTEYDPAPEGVVSIGQKEQLRQRAYIRQYSRESLVDWSVTRVNGRMQFNYLVFSQAEVSIDRETFESTVNYVYLVLDIDDSGLYRQRRFEGDVSGFDPNKQIGSPIEPKANGERIRWIPVEVVSDERKPSGNLSPACGYLESTVDLALHRYRMSADHKQAIHYGQPTVMLTGMSDSAFKQFEIINGRSHVEIGSTAVNLLPDGVVADILTPASDLTCYTQYFESNDQDQKDVGASLNEEKTGNETATKAEIDHTSQTAVMMTIAKNAEQAFRRSVLYAGMYAGLWGQDDIESHLDDVVIVVPKSFGKDSFSTESIIQMFTAGVMPVEEVANQIISTGKTTIEDSEEWVARLEDSASNAVRSLINGGLNTD